MRVVAYIGGVKSSRSVSTWAEGASTPGEADQQRLRNAFYAASLLRESYDANPALNDQAPAQVLREGDQMKAARDVITAAKSFAHIG